MIGWWGNIGTLVWTIDQSKWSFIDDYNLFAKMILIINVQAVKCYKKSKLYKKPVKYESDSLTKGFRTSMYLL